MAEDAEQLAGVREGEILDGKYRVERVLGVGGMGVVVAARHIDLEHRVALKFLLPALLSNAEAVGRFAREARAAVRIQNEHVARVLDTGTLENGAPYMVMDFLEGEDLSGWIRHAGRLSVEQAVEFVLQACVAVAEAHSLGIVHRDLKPANLFCIRRNDGQYIIKVLDFGISKVTEVGAPAGSPVMSMTRTSVVMGSPHYMSPEQVQSAKDVDTRTDIWSLGVVLFELLTGKVPFTAESFGEMAVKIATEEAPSTGSFRPDVAPLLDAVIGRCLAKNRASRYGNIAELSQALLPFAPSRARASVDRISGILHAATAPAPRTPDVPGQVGWSPHPGDTALAQQPPADTAAPWSDTKPPVAAKRMMVGVFGLILGVATLAAGVVVLRRAPTTTAQAGGKDATPESSASAPSPGTEPSGTAAEERLPPPKSGPSIPTEAPTLAPLSEPLLKHRRDEKAGGPLTSKTHEPPSRADHSIASAAASEVPPPPPPPGPNCDPNYTVDLEGNKKFKPECFLKKAP